MKIAFITSSRDLIPPHKTGGVGYSVYYLAKELARQGHEVDLFAAPNSHIEGVNVRQMCATTINFDPDHANLKERVERFYDNEFLCEFFATGKWKNYDLIQYFNYLFYEILPFTRLCSVPILVRINYPHNEVYDIIKKAIKDWQGVRYVPDSEFIKELMPGLNYTEVVYPAIDFNDFPFSRDRGKYLLFIGRICPEKGVHSAIEVARQAGMKLVIAGPVRKNDRLYFHKSIKPHVDNDKIIYVGEVDFKTKLKIYQKAMATLFPIQWDEPFGMVMLESMACGIPVIAFDRAATREVIKNNVNGFIVPEEDIESMADAVKQTVFLDRRIVRESTEKNFSINKQAAKYADIAKKLIKN